MLGKDVGTLTLKYQKADADPEELWLRRGSFGEKWRKGSAQVHSSTVPFNFLIEGSVGSGQSGNIAIDDISVDLHACPIDEAMTCNFEDDFCSFVNKGDMEWKRLQAKDTIVLHDHTYFSEDGYLAVLNLSDNKQGHGVLEGGLHAGGRKACVHAYFIKNSQKPAAMKICLKKVEDEEVVNCREIDVTGQHKQWRHVALDVDTEGVFLETEEWMVK